MLRYEIGVVQDLLLALLALVIFLAADKVQRVATHPPLIVLLCQVQTHRVPPVELGRAQIARKLAERGVGGLLLGVLDGFVSG